MAGYLIRNGFDTSKLASTWLGCRSLLAGDANVNRLQAGSYKLVNERRAWRVVAGFENASGLIPGLFTFSGEGWL